MAQTKKLAVPPQILRDLVLRLWKRSKELKHEEEIAKQEDPLMHEERADLSETVDSSANDVSQATHQARLDLIQSARLEIRKALAKVRIGTYGICENCKKPIDIARLKAMPQATKCMECSKKAER